MKPAGEVLVVDDDSMLNKLMCHFVELAGLPVRSALDGHSALLSAQQFPPTLVLLDLMLPDTTGFEVCLQLKRETGTASTAVVIVTALDDDASRKRGLECGATDYLVKPFCPDQLIELIKKYAA